MAQPWYLWLHESANTPPVIVSRYGDLIVAGLTKLPTGDARLTWVLSEEFPYRRGMFARLSWSEAQAVFDTPNDVGLLERVRGSMSDPHALVWAHDGKRFGADAFTIPDTGSEPEFSEAAMEAALTIDLRIDVADFEQHGYVGDTPDERCLRTYLNSMLTVTQ